MDDTPAFRDIVVNPSIQYVKNLDGSVRRPLQYTWIASVSGTRQNWSVPCATIVTHIHMIGLANGKDVYPMECTAAEIAEAFYYNRIFNAHPIATLTAMKRLNAYVEGEPLVPKWRISEKETAPVTRAPALV